MKLVQPLKYPGGKAYLADWILSLFPPRDSYRVYVEACFGGGAVLLAHDPEGKGEVANDVDPLLTTFWEVLQSQHLFQEFKQRCEATPFSRPAWLAAKAILDNGSSPNPVETAWAVFVAARQGMAGMSHAWSPLSTSRLRGGMLEQSSAWLGAVDGLPAVHARLRRVAVERADVVDLIRRYDKSRIVVYIDPPYFPDTRTAGLYRHEMDVAGHERLLVALAAVGDAYLLVSGYDHPSYAAALAGWERHERRVDNKMSKTTTKPPRTEVVWRNFDVQGRLLRDAAAPAAGVKANDTRRNHPCEDSTDSPPS